MANIYKQDNLSIVRDALLSVGYDSKAIVYDYDFAVKNGQMDSEQVDLVAFSDPFRHDIRTSCIAAHRFTANMDLSDMLDKLSFLAVPLALIAKEDFVEIWPIRTGGSPKPLQQLGYDQLTPFFAEHRRDFSADAINAAKFSGLQTSFFDLDPTLVEFAYNATQTILVSRFEEAVGVTRNSLLSEGVDKTIADTSLAQIALQILAAAILEDKRMFGNVHSLSAVQLLKRAESNFSQYFDLSMVSKIGENNIELMHDRLRHNVTFRSFTNEMLGYFYENTFVNPELRKELGIYYTPSSIAKQILTRLPVEDLPSQGRVVFDGSCGSGNLLLAAYERLASLLPKMWGKEETHDYLVKHIHGMDVDPFAALVARLSLFLISLPSGDSWDIKSDDFIKYTEKSLSPTILIGNPPFKEYRSWEGKRFQKASQFLERYLDLLPDNGLLGIVLPETFLETSSCKDTRRRLLNECDILEMWQLPEGMFPVSQVATIVVLARKFSRDRPAYSSLPLRVRRVHSLHDDKRRFLEQGQATLSYVVPTTQDWLSNSNFTISSSILDATVWRNIKTERCLGDIALVRNGILPGEAAQSTNFSDEVIDNNWKPWLPGTRSLNPYMIRFRTETKSTKKKAIKKYVKYPGNLLRPRRALEPYFAIPNAKVLVNSGRAPGNPWRIFGAIDSFGYYASQSFHCVIPTSDVTVYELVGFLNSPVASAWIDSKNRRRWIDEKILRKMPFPSFSETQKTKLKETVTQIMTFKRQGIDATQYGNIEKIRELIQSVDNIVFDALGLSIDAREVLLRFFSKYCRPGFERQEFEPSHPEDSVATKPASRYWKVTGQVISVSPDEGKVTLWVRGFNDGQSFQFNIPESMPGWALRENSVFHALIPINSRMNASLKSEEFKGFMPVDFSFLSADELKNLFNNLHSFDQLYYSDDKYGH